MAKFVVIMSFIKTWEIEAPNESTALLWAEQQREFTKKVSVDKLSNWHVHEITGSKTK